MHTCMHAYTHTCPYNMGGWWWFYVGSGRVLNIVQLMFEKMS